ncbi:MAG: type II toxin-antitoxin system HicA family toxin [Saprospiraceae bacterium]
MSKLEKAIYNLLNPSSTVTFQELEYILGKFGYHEKKTGKTAGSRKAFLNDETMHIIRLHEPHPQNEVKEYVKKYIIEELKSQYLL